MTWWDQELLASSRVLVVGAGALGNEVVKNLVLLGVGSILVVDMDVIEVSNLSRCAFFLPDDAGRPKAEVLAQRAMVVNPEVEVIGIVGRVQELGVGFATRATVIVGALDNVEARVRLNELSWRSGTPWIDGAIGELDGSVRLFDPPSNCFECTLDNVDYEAMAERRSCRLLGVEAPETGAVPTSITTASVIGGLQAQEAVKLIHRQAGLLPERDAAQPNGFRFNGMFNDGYGEQTPHLDDDTCPAHDLHTPCREIEPRLGSLAELAALTEWDRATVGLGADHVISWTCVACDVKSVDGRQVWRIEAVDAGCPSCGAIRKSVVAASVQVPSAEADLPWDTWRFVPDDHLVVSHDLDVRYFWLRDDDAVPGSWR